jgi:hypothetical protein
MCSPMPTAPLGLGQHGVGLFDRRLAAALVEIEHRVDHRAL